MRLAAPLLILLAVFDARPAWLELRHSPFMVYTGAGATLAPPADSSLFITFHHSRHSSPRACRRPAPGISTRHYFCRLQSPLRALRPHLT